MNGHDLLRAMNGIDPEYLGDEDDGHHRHKRRFFRHPAALVAAIAAALALTVTAGAVVIRSRNYHKDSVEHYIRGGDSIVSYTVDATENRHIRVTFDSVWSTGIMATAIMTVEPLDDEGKEMAKHLSFIGYSYADGSQGDEELFIPSGIMWADSTMYSNSGQLRYRCRFYIDGKDVSKTVRVHLGHFTSDDWDSTDPDETVDYGICADVDFTPNTKLVELFAENGHSLFLSPLEIYQREKNSKGELYFCKNSDIYLIRSDGTLEPLSRFADGKSSAWSAEDPYQCYTEIEFIKIVNIDDCKGVKVGDTEFLRR